ncbi:MAG: DsrE family protein [Pseudomonadota bacterium]|nr:DsrE family protein [Hydrogenophaga sp.]MDP1905841.1 DsrE family protein [Pseudomonadota bacterium]MDP2352414.1 DsrE family protein [Pseudomonadota bacterium]
MITSFRTLLSTLLLATLLAAPSVQAASTQPEARHLVMVEKTSRYRVVYDIQSDEMAAGISRGLYYARGLFEAFRKQGVETGQVDVHLVLHGDAAAMLLIDETYQLAINDPFAVNPNAKIAQDLIDLGVSVEICHSAMRSKGWKPKDVLPNVTIVHDGYTRLIKLQNDGYAYIGGY